MKVILVGVLQQFSGMPSSCKSNEPCAVSGSCTSQEEDIRATYYALDGSSEANASSSADKTSEARSNDAIADKNNPLPCSDNKIEEGSQLGEVVNNTPMVPGVSKDRTEHGEAPGDQTTMQSGVSGAKKYGVNDKAHIGQYTLNSGVGLFPFSQALEGDLAAAKQPSISFAPPPEGALENKPGSYEQKIFAATPLSSKCPAATPLPGGKKSQVNPPLPNAGGRRVMGTFPKPPSLPMKKTAYQSNSTSTSRKHHIISPLLTKILQLYVRMV